MSSQNNPLLAILNSRRTVFTLQALIMLTGQKSSKLTKSLHYFASIGKIQNPRRGIYTKDGYDVEEMACPVRSGHRISRWSMSCNGLGLFFSGMIQLLASAI